MLRPIAALVIVVGVIAAGAPPPASRAAGTTAPAQALDNGVRKTTKITSELDKLYRIDVIARAHGRSIARAAVPSLPDDLRGAVAGRRIALDDRGNVQVFVEVADAPSAIRALLALGFALQRVSPDGNMLQGMLPIASLAAAAALPEVGQIRPPSRPVLNAGSVLTQGDAILQANVMRAAQGVDGTGVRVGVLSDGAEGLPASQGSGDLPLAVDTTTCAVIASAPFGEPANATDVGAGAEATAMAEIVHDLAPGAQIMIGYFGLNVSTATTLDYMAAVSCLDQFNDVVVDDIASFNDGLYDGTSAISQNASTGLNNPANPIRGYYTSAGNFARNHYEGAWFDSGFDVTIGGDFWRIHQYHASGSTTDAGQGYACSVPIPNCGDRVTLFAGGSVTVFLQWDELWSNAVRDYDLLVHDGFTNTISVVSGQSQAGAGSHPAEAFSITNTHGVATSYDILIGNYKNLAPPVTFDEFVLCTSCDTFPNGTLHNFNTRAGSIANNSDAGGGVVSLGAINQADPSNDDIEVYSSIGYERPAAQAGRSGRRWRFRDWERRLLPDVLRHVGRGTARGGDRCAPPQLQANAESRRAGR